MTVIKATYQTRVLQPQQGSCRSIPSKQVYRQKVQKYVQGVGWSGSKCSGDPQACHSLYSFQLGEIGLLLHRWPPYHYAIKQKESLPYIAEIYFNLYKKLQKTLTRVHKFKLNRCFRRCKVVGNVLNSSRYRDLLANWYNQVSTYQYGIYLEIHIQVF